MKRRLVIKTLGSLALSSMIPLHAISRKRETCEVLETDILVVGGGTAGVIAAIQAGRAGCKTILLENGSQLGGTMTTGGVNFPGIFHAWGKQIIGGIGWELVTDAVNLSNSKLPDFKQPTGRQHWKHQIEINAPAYIILAEEKCLKAGVDIRYYETPVQVKYNDGFWIVDVVGKGTSCKIRCKQLIDCTGNASLTSLAGYKVLKEYDTQPGSLIFELGGCDWERIKPEELNELYQEALKEGKLLQKDAYSGVMALLRVNGGRATQHVLHADSSTSITHTKANIKGRSSMLRIIRFVRSLPGCEQAYIAKMQPETAVRETYRIDGLYQITHDDYVSGKVDGDALSYSFYPIDLHVEEGVTPKHLAEGKVATIPLRALIPKNSENFIVAGRCVSSDRLANSALRVQASCMGMGQVAGCAAALACITNKQIRDVSLPELKKMIKKFGGIVPE